MEESGKSHKKKEKVGSFKLKERNCPEKSEAGY
jgi:hypothetical protein